MDDDDTPDVDLAEREALLMERGYNPSELSDSEQDDILGDIMDTDADNDRLSDVEPSDERDGTQA